MFPTYAYTFISLEITYIPIILPARWNLSSCFRIKKGWWYFKNTTAHLLPWAQGWSDVRDSVLLPCCRIPFFLTSTTKCIIVHIHMKYITAKKMSGIYPYKSCKADTFAVLSIPLFLQDEEREDIIKWRLNHSGRNASLHWNIELCPWGDKYSQKKNKSFCRTHYIHGK